MDLKFIHSENYFLKASVVVFSLLIISSACRREEQRSLVPAFTVARKIQNETGLNRPFNLTGSFDYISEKMSLSGNFWVKKGSTAVRIKVFGPLGLGQQEFTLRDLGLDILNFVFGFADTLTGVLTVKGNVYSHSDGSYRFVIDRSGLVLSVSTDDYKIYLMDYREYEGLKIPRMLRMIFRNGVLNVRIKQVGLPS